jgi:aquaporin Z
MLQALRQHWPEYLMEGALLGLFMVSTCAFGSLLEHPGSPVHQALPDGTVRRILGGIAMGGTAITLFFSPWGKQSGAHINPAVTLTFLRFGKVSPWDALFYVLVQFVGGVAGVLVMVLLLRGIVAHPSVHYATTLPGPAGPGVAFLVEVVISFAMMMLVLVVSNTKRLARFTGIFAGVLVAVNITLAAPLSGMSMNPARSFGSALPAMDWSSLWIYFTAPPLGMLVAAQTYLWLRGRTAVHCAKLHHQNNKRCIFCEYCAARAAPHQDARKEQSWNGIVSADTTTPDVAAIRRG